MSATATPAFNSSALTGLGSNKHEARQPVTRKTERDMRGTPVQRSVLDGGGPDSKPGERSCKQIAWQKNNGVPPTWEARRCRISLDSAAAVSVSAAKGPSLYLCPHRHASGAESLLQAMCPP